MSYALVLRDALVLVARAVWTVRRDSRADQATCHVALDLPVLADSNLARRRGGYLPATASHGEKDMHTHATCAGPRRTNAHTAARADKQHACLCPPSFSPSFPSLVSLLSLLLSLSGPTKNEIKMDTLS